MKISYHLQVKTTQPNLLLTFPWKFKVRELLGQPPA